jgi:hypothetical protein
VILSFIQHRGNWLYLQRIRCFFRMNDCPRGTFFPQKLALTSPACGGYFGQNGVPFLLNDTNFSPIYKLLVYWKIGHYGGWKWINILWSFINFLLWLSVLCLDLVTFHFPSSIQSWTPRTGDRLVMGLLLTQNSTSTINAHTIVQCPKWDSNWRSKCSSRRRQFMSNTARPLWSALLGLLCQTLLYVSLWHVIYHNSRRIIIWDCLLNKFSNKRFLILA